MPSEEPAGQRVLRVFVTDAGDDGWTELTAGGPPAVRISAADLQQAQRARSRIREQVAVVLDVTVLVADDYRSARCRMTALGADPHGSIEYAGTLDGLAGLIADIFVAGVADGVTLVPATPAQDVRKLGEATLSRIAQRMPFAA